LKKNIGTADRWVRLGIGTLAVAAGVYIAYRVSVWLGALVVLFGAFAVYEAAAGWCALYALMGKNTCPVR
jgi:hypothetical protein